MRARLHTQSPALHCTHLLFPLLPLTCKRWERLALCLDWQFESVEEGLSPKSDTSAAARCCARAAVPLHTTLGMWRVWRV
jgi:hypothetical protein